MSIYSLLLSTLAIVSVAVNAAPTTASSIKDCTNLRIQDLYLVGECLTGQDATTRIESTVFLYNIVTTKNDLLQWGQGGSRCENCKVNSDLVMTCTCSETTYPQFGPTSSLNLAEHINVYSGFLLSDFKGPPKPPTNVSNIKIPADTSYNVRQGGAQCYAPQYNFCKNFPILDAGKCPDFHTIISTYGVPLQCQTYYNPVPDTPYYYIHEYMAIESVSGAWEFYYYDDLECKGKPIKVVKGDDLGKCLKFSERNVFAFTAKPLWNADY